MTNEAGGDRGISHREISWRAAVLRRARPARTPPRRLGPVLLLLVLAYLLGGIGAPALSLEEAVQTSLAADAGVLVTRPSSLLPGGTAGFAPATSEPVRLARLTEGPFTDRLVHKFNLPVSGWRGPNDEVTTP